MTEETTTEDPRPAHIIRYFRNLASERELSMTDLAKKLGWGQSQLNRVFKGHIELRIKDVYQLSAVFGIAPVEAFQWADDQASSGPNPAP